MEVEGKLSRGHNELLELSEGKKHENGWRLLVAHLKGKKIYHGIHEKHASI